MPAGLPRTRPQLSKAASPWHPTCPRWAECGRGCWSELTGLELTAPATLFFYFTNHQEVLRELIDMLTPTVLISPEATSAYGEALVGLALAVFRFSFQSAFLVVAKAALPFLLTVFPYDRRCHGAGRAGLF